MTSVQLQVLEPGSHVTVRRQGETPTSDRLGSIIVSSYFDGRVEGDNLVVPVSAGVGVDVRVTSPDGTMVVHHVGPMEEGEYEAITSPTGERERTVYPDGGVVQVVGRITGSIIWDSGPNADTSPRVEEMVLVRTIQVPTGKRDIRL